MKIDEIRIISGQSIVLVIGDRKYRLSIEAWAEKKFKKGDELSGADFKYVLRQSLKWMLKDYALRQLSISQKSKVELKGKLQFKAKKWLIDSKTSLEETEVGEIIFEVMTFLEEKQFIDDKNFVEFFVRKSRKKSNRQIEYELKQKRVEGDIVKTILKQRSDEEKRAIENFLDKKMKKNEKLTYVEKNKLMSSLTRKGFPLDLVKNLIDERD